MATTPATTGNAQFRVRADFLIAMHDLSYQKIYWSRKLRLLTSRAEQREMTP
jgi:hypothetical protein